MFIKGMDKNMTCKGLQFKQGEIAEVEGKSVICEHGLHYVENPHDVFGYYPPGVSRYFEVEPLGEISRKEGEDSKCCTNKLKIGAEISFKAICQFSVKAFFERFKFKEKIESADTNNAGDCGTANAGNYGAANAGDCGAANAGDCGAANAGYRGAANAGDYGAANVQSEGSASTGKKGVAVCMGNGSKAKGQDGSVLVLVNRDSDGNIIDAKTLIVGKDDIKPDTWYALVDGKITEVES
jgi:hypothetical protein